MVGSRAFFTNSKKIKQFCATKSPDGRTQFILRLYQQAKQISQIITYIWRWADDSDPIKSKAAKKLKEYFEHPTLPNQSPGENLKQLFDVVPSNSGTDSAKLLYAVFGDPNLPNNKDYIFPIFDQIELGNINPELGYSFTINVNSFHGTIVDATNNDPQLFSFEIPYPPRPITGHVAVTLKDLDDWINNRVEDEYFSENPFIPTTCS